jgi:hypothetical protein
MGTAVSSGKEHELANKQRELTQDELKQIITRTEEKKGIVQIKKGAQCEITECKKWFLFTKHNTCQQCMAPVQCIGCGRFLCPKCFRVTCQTFGHSGHPCDFHSRACLGCG